ncbi:MAG: hypothetical protein V2A79_03080 [Planctomycetota bacterium]
MLKTRRNSILGLAVVLSAGMALSSAYADFWAQPSGVGEHFTYSDGGDLYGHFGEPSVEGGTFSFPFVNLQAIATGGGTNSASDAVYFDLQADPGWAFGLIRVTAVGEYTVTGPGSSASVDAILTVSENVHSDPREWLGEWAPDPEMPITGGSDVWLGLDVMDLSIPIPRPADSVHFELRFDLLAVSGPGGGAEIGFQPGSGLVIAICTSEAPELTGDFDEDGDVDLTDYATFGACLTGPAYSPTADLDADGDVDLDDFAAWQPCLTGPGLAAGEACGNMDLDTDGDVDLADYDVFQCGYTGSGHFLPHGCDAADLDTDHDVDVSDFATFQESFTG